VYLYLYPYLYLYLWPCRLYIFWRPSRQHVLHTLNDKMARLSATEMAALAVTSTTQRPISHQIYIYTYGQLLDNRHLAISLGHCHTFVRQRMV